MNAFLLLVVLAQAGERKVPVEIQRTSHAYQVLDPTGKSWVEITQKTEHTPRDRYAAITVFTMPSGEQYAFRQALLYNPFRFEDSLEFPNHQRIKLTGRPASKAPDATTSSPSRMEGELVFESHKVDIDMSTKESDGMFRNKAGREFRAALPVLSDDLIEALVNLKRNDLCSVLQLCASAAIFFEAYRDGWLAKEGGSWELQRIR